LGDVKRIDLVRSHEASIAALDSGARRALSGRLAAILFMGSGVVTLASFGGMPSPVGRTGTAAIGVASVVAGLITLKLPWGSWPQSRSLWLVPVALAMVSLRNWIGLDHPYDYGVFFVVVHVWIGLSHPPRTSLLFGPLTLAAYAGPLLVGGHPSDAYASALTVVPVSILVGEATAWLMVQLDRSEFGRQELEGVLHREQDALERLRRSEEELQFLAYHDRLTGLPNRQFLHTHLDLTLSRARRTGEAVAVCVVDLDKFKLVNDTLGHSAGDVFLREVGSRLQERLREGDLMARVGGDEFVAVLPSLPTPSHEAAEASVDPILTEIRERMVGALEEPFVIEETEFQISASLGVALFPRDGADARSLLNEADRAMYRAKREEGRPAVAAGGPKDRAGEEPSLMSALRRAPRDGSLSLRYQPIVELVTDRTIGAESLLRWNGPGGFSEAGRFIHLAEDMGLISQIGEWVLGELRRQSLEWRRQDLFDAIGLLTFNLSPRELWHPSLLRSLQALAEVVDKPKVLTIEVTESAIGMDPARATDTLSAASDMGFLIALDDFGTGYSSLSRLRSLPIDVVKIDRTFLDGAVTDRRARTLLRSTIRLANGLGMVPLVEGVETPEQRDAVVAAGCSLAQGHLFDQAIGADAFASRLRASRGALETLRG
jgi:diguanylate cyclase (GGDEF)-like protein